MMRLLASTVIALLLLLPAASQTPSNKTPAQPTATPANAVATSAEASQVPHLVRFSGSLQERPNEAAGTATDGTSGTSVRNNASAPTKVVGMTFSLYSQQTGGVPLWSEVQNVQVGASGNYTVQLGATKPDGLPVELFTSTQAQWLGVRQEGEAEQARVMLVSVPYALKAADAETFGGKPPSAYASATPNGQGGANGVGLPQAGNGKQSPPTGGSGTTNYIALWTSSSNLGNSAIYQSNGNIGIGTTTPDGPLQVVDNGRSGVAIYGDATATGGIGIQGSSVSSAGIGVYGANTSHAGGSGVYGLTDGRTGTGVYGLANNASGENFGVSGRSESTTGIGVEGDATNTSGANFGVEGTTESPDGTGVYGVASSTSGTTVGVSGQAESTDGTGVYGVASSTMGTTAGVEGDSSSTSGIGVLGKADATTGAAFGVKGTTASSGGVGVYAVSNATSGTNYGLEGTNASPDGSGVLGANNSTTGNALGIFGQTESTDGIGIYAVAIDNSSSTAGERPIAVWGTSNEPGAIGVLGTTDDAIAVAGTNNASNVAAADFINEESTRIDAAVLVTRGSHYGGDCILDVSGNVECTGVKSAVVPVDGGTRKVALYAVESPENWFEDIGSARLSSGSAVVQLESTFAQTVNSGVEYHVFLTPNGDCKGLYVTNKSASSFEVRELGGGTASIGFDYRVIVRRKGYEDIRMADRTEIFALMDARNPVTRKAPAAAKPAPEQAKTRRLRASRAVPNLLPPPPVPSASVSSKARN
jgi:hypothetical protein